MRMSDSGWEAYRRGWKAAVVVLAGLGLVTALVFVGWSTNLVAFLMGGTLVASVYLSVGLAQERKTPELVRDVLRWAGRAGLCVVAICGYATAIGMATLWLVLLLGVTSPPLVNWLWPHQEGPVRRPAPEPPVERQPRTNRKPDRKPKMDRKPKPDRKPKTDRKAKSDRKRQPIPEPPPPLPEPVVHEPAAPVDLSNFTDLDLCLAWRRSFTELEGCTTDAQRLAVIAARHAYLDELERRAPDAFAQWLESGPRAAGNPAKFFAPRTNHGEPE
ncbi:MULTISPECIES: hypothetical protein [unclassified Kribbella]|uniref:hypothetical protein n=1 Tax=unclassified Kribbella TaxID=2644121 RepID=UPI0033E7481F